MSSPTSPDSGSSPIDGPAEASAHRTPAGSDVDPGQLYHELVGGVSRMFEAAVLERSVEGRLLPAMQDLEQLAPLVVASTARDRDLLRQAMGTYAEGEGFVLPHSANVAILAVVLGRELGIEDGALVDLCLAGLAHDVGSVHLPPGLLAKAEGLSSEEWDEMRARPTHTYETLRKLGERYEHVADIAHQVYERLDGSGYPRGLQGDEILAEARILGTVDFFESFAHPRPYKDAIAGTANHGIQLLMRMADKFGSVTLKALIGSIGLFPIGSYVRLSGGEVGRVVDVKQENPMRPLVEILLNRDRRPPDERRVMDLIGAPHIYVTSSLTGSDLRELGLLPEPSKLTFPGHPNHESQ